MDSRQEYLFTSERLGFRNWEEKDLDAMAAISGDKEVMAFFPGPQTKEYVSDFMKRMQAEFQLKGYCYFAVEQLTTKTLIGFIGLHEQTFDSDFTPCIDIGWRLDKRVWNRGYATEGAKRCLEYAFNELKLASVYSIAPLINIKSARIMEKIGMHKVKHFIFDLLKHDSRLRECVLYKVTREIHASGGNRR